MNCECFGAAAVVGSLAELPAALEGLTAHVADSGALMPLRVKGINI